MPGPKPAQKLGWCTHLMAHAAQHSWGRCTLTKGNRRADGALASSSMVACHEAWGPPDAPAPLLDHLSLQAPPVCHRVVEISTLYQKIAQAWQEGCNTRPPRCMTWSTRLVLHGQMHTVLRLAMHAAVPRKQKCESQAALMQDGGAGWTGKHRHWCCSHTSHHRTASDAGL